MMDANELRSALKKEKRKMMCESALRALLLGAAAGLFALFAITLVSRLTVYTPPVGLYLAICLPTGVLAALGTLFTVFYPTNRRVAARLDECGMAERTITMLEYADSNADAVMAQRRDTVAHLESGAPARTVFRMSKTHKTLFGVSLKELLLVLFCGVLVAGMLAVPHDTFATAPESAPKPEEIRQAAIVDKLVEELRKVVTDAENSEKLEKQLNDLIDALEQKLKDSENEYDKIADIGEVQEKMNEAFENERAQELSKKYEKILDEEQKLINDLMNEAKQKLLEEDLFSKMRDVVEESENEDKFEKELNDRIDELENRFDLDRDAEKRIKDINEAKKEIDRSFEEQKEQSESEEERQKLEEEQQKLDDLLNEEKDKIAREDLFGKIREVIAKSNNTKHFDREINELIDEREESYKNSKTNRDKINSILMTMAKTENAFYDEIEKSGNTEEQHALEVEEREINKLLFEELKRLLDDYLSEQLREIAEKSENEEEFDKKLNERIDEFEKKMSQSDKTQQKTETIDQMKQDLEKMFAEEAEKQPSEEGKQAMQDENAQMQAVLDFAKQLIKSKDGEQGQQGEEGKQEGEQEGDGDPNEDVKPGENEKQGGDPHNMDDVRNTPVYDSERGKVPFKDVLDEYIKKYNDGKSRGEIPEDIIKIIESYFAELQDVGGN